jgi:hypothetical protein
VQSSNEEWLKTLSFQGFESPTLESSCRIWHQKSVDQDDDWADLVEAWHRAECWICECDSR